MKKQLAIWAGLWLTGLWLIEVGTAGTAAAQAVYAGPGLSDPALPPYEIMSIVRSTGLAPLTRPMRRGPYYVLVAVDRVGRQMRVVVDAQLGDIVNLRPALAAGSYGPELGRPYGPPGMGAVPPDTTGATGYGVRQGGDPRPSGDPRPGGDPYAVHPSADNALPPTPPRSIPNARVNAPPPSAAAPPPSAAPPPTRLAVAEPALPPLPPLPRPRPKVAMNEAPAASPTEATAPPKPEAPAAAPPSAAPNAADEAAKSIE